MELVQIRGEGIPHVRFARQPCGVREGRHPQLGSAAKEGSREHPSLDAAVVLVQVAEFPWIYVSWPEVGHYAGRRIRLVREWKRKPSDSPVIGNLVQLGKLLAMVLVWVVVQVAAGLEVP